MIKQLQKGHVFYDTEEEWNCLFAFAHASSISQVKKELHAYTSWLKDLAEQLHRHLAKQLLKCNLILAVQIQKKMVKQNGMLCWFIYTRVGIILLNPDIFSMFLCMFVSHVIFYYMESVKITLSGFKWRELCSMNGLE